MLRPILISLALTGAAQAQDMRPIEAEKLAQLDHTFGMAIRAALSGGARGDVDLLQEVMAGAPLPPLATALAGDWRCRTLKLGGITPLTAYAPFNCRITADGAKFRFEKLSGSQRTSGTVQLLDGQMIYLGVGTVGEAPARDYAGLHPAFLGTAKVTPQIAIVEQPERNRIRLLFPAPVNESLFDILYLTRTDG